MNKKLEYVFTYDGTREAFLNNLTQFREDGFNNKMYYLDDFIVKVIDDEIHFGVERGGHSHGYWYIPKITESDNQLEFRGTIQYLGPDTTTRHPTLRKVLDSIDTVAMYTFLMPVTVIIRIYRAIDWCVRKIRHNPKPKEITTEDRLFDLMHNYLGCSRKTY